MPQTPVILSPQPIRPRSTPVGSLFDNFVVRPATPLLPSACAKDTVWHHGQQAISSRSACRILYRACVLGSVDDITRVMDCHRFDKDSLRGPTLRAADGGFVNCVRCLIDRLSSDECSNFDELMVEVALVAVRRGDLDMLDLVVGVVCKHDTALFCEWVLPAAVDHPQALSHLLSRGIKPSRKTSTAVLNRAAARATVGTFKLLLQSGASPLAPGVFPLHAAAGSPARHRVPMMEYLVEELHVPVGALDEANLLTLARRDICGTPLHHALGNCQWDQAYWLLGRGASAKATNQFGLTPQEVYVERFSQHQLPDSKLGWDEEQTEHFTEGRLSFWQPGQNLRHHPPGTHSYPSPLSQF
ncbi:hypothetical protein PG991_009175 [Apiospora marii]|uniref:Ankyrin n=1 Tax=Apiospora marii TaxID=335849 RepID=A0ABR1RKZ3_9PEZI